MDDDCDFDTLCDMLEEDDFDHNAQQQMDTKGHMDSSDDDIDEDELDKLAALMEEESVESKQPRIPKSETSNSKTVTTKCENDTGDSSEASLIAKSNSKEENKLNVVSAVTATDDSSSSTQGEEVNYLLKLKELQAMQEKIKLLEAELMQKATSQKSPPLNGGSTTICTTKISQDSQRVRTPSQENKTKTSLRPLEDDIFGAIESSSLPESKLQKGLANVKRPEAKCNLEKENSHITSSATPLAKPDNDSDSDWEDLDGERPGNLSNAGKEMKRLLNQGPRQRVAHAAKYEPAVPKRDPSVIEKSPRHQNTSWKNKSASPSVSNSMNSTGPSRSTISGPSSNSSSGQALNGGNYVNERFSGIKIVNPLVSSSQMSSLMEGRKNIRLSRLESKVGSLDLKSDWVTIGVVVSKTDAKKSQKGNQYCIWRLSDLDDCDKIINFFLFKKVYQEHWKTLTGTVIGLLNPTIMQKEENKSSSEVSITLDNPRQMLIMGRSRDLGKCRAKTKAGNDCNNFVNITKGEYCTYHVQSAYKKHSAKRSELQAGFSGVVPKSFERKIFQKGGTVMYGGQSFSTTGHSNVPKRGKKVSIQSLQQHHIKKAQDVGKAKASTLELHDLLPEDKKLLNQLKTDKHEKFHEALSMPTAGSMNFVKHMKMQEKIKEKEKQGSQPVEAVSVQNFLKSHEKDMKAKLDCHNRRAASRPSGSSVSTATLADRMPTLGRGLSDGDDVFLDLDDVSTTKISFKAERAKQKALAVVQAKGGIKKEDPNLIKKSVSPKHAERIKKRLAESSPDEPNDQDENSDKPPKKRSRALGGVDLESPEVQKLLHAKSKHEGALTEREQEKMDEYFDPLEKKEAMEEKMKGITKVKVKAVTCRQCRYTHYAPKKECREQGHKIISHEAYKRFFQCKKCRHRTITLEKYPQHCCKNCGSDNFEKTSMLKEKTGPKLASEELLLRGEEIKFLSSLN